MAYFKINNIDFSRYVNELAIKTKSIYNAETNAAGNTVVDYINSKRTISVGIIPLDAATAKELLTVVSGFNVSLSFLNPHTNELEENVACIITSNDIDYYTIQANKVRLNAFSLDFEEL